MKNFIILILILGLVGCTAATDVTTVTKTVNDASVKAFLQVYPQYKALTKKYGQQAQFDKSAPLGMKYAKEAQGLLSKSGLSMESFAALTQKISMGLVEAQMEKSGEGGMFSSVAKQTGISLTSEEKAVIKKHLPQIQKILSEK
jgi:hypothetical protein